MLNLLGCNKDNFLSLIQKMNYKIIKKNEEFYFKYLPNKKKVTRYISKNITTDNPFNVLKNIDFK